MFYSPYMYLFLIYAILHCTFLTYVNRLDFLGDQSHGACGWMEVRWCAHHHDVSHGEETWPHETRYQKGDNSKSKWFGVQFERIWCALAVTHPFTRLLIPSPPSHTLSPPFTHLSHPLLLPSPLLQALVEMDGEPFKCFVAQRADWAKYDLYRSPGPLQVGYYHPLANTYIPLTC